MKKNTEKKLQEIDEKTLKKINAILGEYLASGNESKAKRKLHILKVNLQRSLKKNEFRKTNVIEKLEVSKKLFD